MNTWQLTTEDINKKSKNIDILSTSDIIKIINDEDKTVADIVGGQLQQVGKAVDVIYDRLKRNGRLFYIGCGTSGRIGILDAAECPPTYGTNPQMVQGIIGGGIAAITIASEGVEDDFNRGASDISAREVTRNDVILGITASGRAPYVIGALECAKEYGAATIGISNVETPLLRRCVDVSIEAVTGPEVITGSTRMKAGTAQKLILNMISTAVMIKLGKVYQNLMVDLQPSNKKLRERKIRIVMTATNTPREEAEKYLEASGENSKVAIVAVLSETDPEAAEDFLKKSGGYVRAAIDMANMNKGKKMNNI